MSIDPNDLFALPPAEQLRIVELIWDHLGDSTTAIPLPEWVEREAILRRDAMVDDPSLGTDHDAMWDRIEHRHG